MFLATTCTQKLGCYGDVFNVICNSNVSRVSASALKACLGSDMLTSACSGDGGWGGDHRIEIPKEGGGGGGGAPPYSSHLISAQDRSREEQLELHDNKIVYRYNAENCNITETVFEAIRTQN